MENGEWGSDEQSMLAACLSVGPTTWASGVADNFTFVETGRLQRATNIVHSAVADIDVVVIDGNFMPNDEFGEGIDATLYIDFNRLFIIITAPSDTGRRMTRTANVMTGYRWLVAEESLRIHFDTLEVDVTGDDLHYLLAVLLLHSLERFVLFERIWQGFGVDAADAFSLHVINAPIHGFSGPTTRGIPGPSIRSQPETPNIILRNDWPMVGVDQDHGQRRGQMLLIKLEIEDLIRQQGFIVPMQVPQLVEEEFNE